MRRLNLLWTALAAIGLVATWIAANHRPPGLEDHALRVAKAFVQGDAATLVGYADPDELRKVGLDRAKAERLIAELVAPRVKQWQDLEPTIEAQVLALGAQGVARVHWKGQGREAALMFEVEPTDHGPRSRLVYHVVRAWDLEHQRLHPNPSLQATPEGRLAGLARDRHTLSKLGVHGIAKRDLAEPIASWDAMERIWRSAPSLAKTLNRAAETTNDPR
ncbi:MAG: hypothetical protein AMXMBFR81_30780 [Chthonomonas sp.]